MGELEYRKVERIEVDTVTLEGELAVPRGAEGLVVFAHGSGSSRFSPRNNFVADRLRSAGLGTLLFDLLTEEEDRVYETRFDIGLLTRRLVDTVKWVSGHPEVEGMNMGLFGSSTGAAAALKAAARLGLSIGAVVSRGGRTDLAMEDLTKVKSPTLLIVGGRDTEVLELNRRTLAELTCERKLEVVEGATHLFEEPGALEEVADLAASWFVERLTP